MPYQLYRSSTMALSHTLSHNDYLHIQLHTHTHLVQSHGDVLEKVIEHIQKLKQENDEMSSSRSGTLNT